MQAKTYDSRISRSGQGKLNVIWLLTATTSVLVVLTCLPLSRSAQWWVRVWEFPRVQLAIVALLLLVLQLLTIGKNPVIGATSSIIVAVCLLYHLWWIYPYSRFKKHEVPAAQQQGQIARFTLVAANVLMDNRDTGRFLALMKEQQPDLLITLESDDWWQKHLDSLESDYPYTVKCPLDNLYGMHLYSKLPLRDASVDYLVEDDIPSIHCQIVLTDDVSVRAHFLHPTPPVPGQNLESTERDAELIMVAKSLQDCDGPILVAGDLNDVAWSPTTRLFRKISGLLDPRVGRGQFNTFHADYWFARWPLDHLFVSDHFQLVEIRRLRPFGSDHFAIRADLALTATPTGRPGGLEAGLDDRQQAEKIIDEKDVSSEDVPRPEPNTPNAVGSLSVTCQLP